MGRSHRHIFDGYTCGSRRPKITGEIRQMAPEGPVLGFKIVDSSVEFVDKFRIHCAISIEEFYRKSSPNQSFLEVEVVLLNRKLERIKSPHAWRNPITFNPNISGINAFQSHMKGSAQRALNATAKATNPTNITKQLTIVFFIVVIV
jgi:hypothetical protein